MESASSAIMERTDRSNPSLSGGRAAGLLVVLGLLLVVGGTVAYVITTATPTKVLAGTDTGGSGKPAKPLTTEAFDAILNAAQKNINDGKLAEAEKIYHDVPSSHPEAQAVHIEYARFLGGQRRPVESYNQYKAAIALGPVDPEVQLEVGTAANMSGHPELAVEHYSAAQAAAPTGSRPPLFLAQVQIKLRKIDEAKANLLMVTKLNPGAAAPAWATLSQLYLD